MTETVKLGKTGTLAAIAVAILIGMLAFFWVSQREQAAGSGSDATSLSQSDAVEAPSSDGKPVIESPTPTEDTLTASSGDDDSTAENDETAEANVSDTLDPDRAPAPAFDIVRVDQEGSAIVAGTAPANSEVSIEVDGKVLGTVAADDTGAFAAMLDIPKSGSAQVIELSASDSHGEPVRSEEQVIIAPGQSILLDQGAGNDRDVAATNEKPAASDLQADSDSAASGSPDTTEAGDSAPAVLLAGKQGVEMMQPSAGARAAASVVLDVISYGSDGAVLLEGRAEPGADNRIHIYLNNALAIAVPVDEDSGWRARLETVRPGIYTLRVDQVDAAGQVRSRFETPFQREDPEVLSTIAPISAGAEISAAVITVQPGYTLWGIASDRYGDGAEFLQIFEANKAQIREPDLIYPGQVFELPTDGQPAQVTE